MICASGALIKQELDQALTWNGAFGTPNEAPDFWGSWETRTSVFNFQYREQGRGEHDVACDVRARYWRMLDDLLNFTG